MSRLSVGKMDESSTMKIKVIPLTGVLIGAPYSSTHKVHIQNNTVDCSGVVFLVNCLPHSHEMLIGLHNVMQ